MDDLPCGRSGKHLGIPGNNLPEDITLDDLYAEFAAFGVIDVEINPQGAIILFETIRGAAEAEKYCILASRPPPHFMGASMMNGHPMMGAMHPMGPAMGMMAPVSPMQYVWPSRPVQPHQPLLLQQVPSANMTVVAQKDGSRNIFSPPNVKAPAPTAAPTAAPSVDEESDVVTGQCTLCKKWTSYTCGRCGVFYCSRECQTQNWPTHQTDCNTKLPPLNFAGKRQLTEVEINGCPVQQQLNHREGRQSPVSKQSSIWRNRNSPEVNKEQQSKSQASNGVKDERTQSSSFRPGSNERRFDERSFNRGSSGSSQRPEQRDERRSEVSRPDDRQGRSFGGSQGKNFGRNRSNDLNADRSPIDTASTSKSSIDENVRSPRSPRSMPSSCGVQQDSDSSNVSPTKSSNTAANLLKNLKLNSPKVESSSEPTVTSPPDVSEEKFEKPGFVSIISGSEVIISHVGDDFIYLQSLRDISQLAIVTHELKVHGARVRHLQRQPKKREFLAAKYSADGAYYRAAVEKRLEVGKYEVQFVDFGNTEAGLTNADMAPLTKGLASVPCMAVKVCLKDVSGVFPDAALTILKSHFCEESTLTVEFGNDLDAGVTLLEKNGDCVNVKLLKAMGKLASSPAIVPPPTPLMAAAAPAPIPIVAAPTPVPVVYLPPVVPAPAVAAPAPAPAPVVAAPAPAPAPVVAAPAPAPVVAAPAPAPVVAAPAPAPAPVVAAPAPAPAPVVAAPAPAPAPVVAAPAPAAPVVAVPAPSQAAVVAAPKRLFSITEVTYVPFPPVGTKCSVLINHFHNDAGFFMACPLDMQAIQSATDLTPKLEAYAVNAQPFRPEPNELCIAKWSGDDAWYRAVCIEIAGNDSFNVLFLEYGNSDTIQYPNFRPFTEELLQCPALSSPCMLSEPSPLSDAQKAKVQSMYKAEWVVEATVLGNSDGTYTLDIPEIKNALA